MKDLKLNGATPNYLIPIAGFSSTRLSARICAGLRDLWKLKTSPEGISDDRLKALLEGYARGVKLMAPEVTDPRDQRWVRTAFSTVYSKLYTPLALEQMLKKDAKKTDLADILAAFGAIEDGKSMISAKLDGIFKVAGRWNDEHLAEFAR